MDEMESETPKRTAIGYSENYDLKEALNDAIRSLPEPPGVYPDILYQYQVTRVLVERGGFSGDTDQLRVEIEDVTPYNIG
jgi:hypothetical protein